MTNLLQNDVKAWLRAKSKKTDEMMEIITEQTIRIPAFTSVMINLQDLKAPYDMYVGQKETPVQLPT